MPIYEYQCQSCSSLFEELTSDINMTTIPCSKCGGEAHRCISKNAFHLKGDGWYVTEYGNKSSSSSQDTNSSSASE